MTPQEIKSELTLHNVKQSDIAKKLNLSRTKISTTIHNGHIVAEKIKNLIGREPFLSNENVMTPQEIKSELILKKISQAEFARQINISKSRLCIVINNGAMIAAEIKKIIDKEPFQIN